MYGCFEHMLKTFFGLIFICIMLVAAYKMVHDPYRPESKNLWSQPVETKPDEGEYTTKQNKAETYYEVPVQTGPYHEYIMENTFQKSGVVMELTPDLEKGLVLVIKTFKEVFGPDFALTITSAHDSFDKHNEWSYHRTGRAVDIRLNDLPLQQRRRAMKLVQERLPNGYKAIWESQYLPNEHLHLQSKN